MIFRLFLATIIIFAYGAKANAQCHVSFHDFPSYNKMTIESAVRNAENAFYMGLVKVEDVRVHYEYIEKSLFSNYYEITLEPIFSYLPNENHENFTIKTSFVNCNYPVKVGRLYQRVIYNNESDQNTLRSLWDFPSEFFLRTGPEKSLIKDISSIAQACKEHGGIWQDPEQSNDIYFGGCHFSYDDLDQEKASDFGRICFDTYECQGSCLVSDVSIPNEALLLEKIFSRSEEFFDKSYAKALKHSKQAICFTFDGEECEVSRPIKMTKDLFLNEHILGRCSEFEKVDRCKESIISFGKIYELKPKQKELCNTP